MFDITILDVLNIFLNSESDWPRVGLFVNGNVVIFTLKVELLNGATDNRSSGKEDFLDSFFLESLDELFDSESSFRDLEFVVGLGELLDI